MNARVLAPTLCLSLVLATGPALAGGFTPAPEETAMTTPVPQVGAFDGFYIGAAAGRASGDGSPFDFGDGTPYGLIAGYNVQQGRLVYGVELGHSAFDDLDYLSLEIDRVTDLRGRVGYVTGDLMVYGAVGWAWAHAQNTSTGADGDLDGASFGVGAEYNVNERFFVGADYTVRDVSGTFGAAVDMDVDLNSLSLRVGFRF
ncbi:MAG: outer membrane protein [Rhodovulum sp.]